MMLTKKKALEETIELWTQLADKAALHVAADKMEIDGPWNDYPYQCPCCKYTELSRIETGLALAREEEYLYCFMFCPLREQWGYYAEKIQEKVKLCIASGSPFKFWSDIVESEEIEHALFYDLEFFCRLIVELAQEALLDCINQDDEGS